MKDERGVSVVVGTIIVIALLFAAFAAIYPIYSRQGVRSAEARHMEAVEGIFLDIQKKVQSMEEGDSESFNINMAPNYPRFVRYPKISGNLSAKNTENDNFIQFKGTNLFSPDQTYIYEGGAMIMKGGETTFMKSEPSMIDVWDSPFNPDDIILKVHFVHIESEGYSATSTGTLTIEIRCDQIESHFKAIDDGSVEVSLENRVWYGNKIAWKDYLKNMEVELTERGYTATADNLVLTIENKEDGDIFYENDIKHIQVRFK